MIEEIRHDNFYKFSDYILRNGPHKRCFRGQRNPEWGLAPGAYRHMSKAEGDGEIQGVDSSAELLNLFGKYAAGMFIDSDYLPKDNKKGHLEIWAQNYGLETSLLDWSHSPFVAAFFAFTDYAEYLFVNIFSFPGKQVDWDSEKIVVWELNINMLPEYVSLVDEMPRRMHRQYSQGSVFLRVEYPHEFDVKGVFESAGADFKLIKHVLPAWDCFIALSSLRSMGIHYASLFPDLHGAAKQANSETKIDMLAEFMKKKYESQSVFGDKGIFDPPSLGRSDS